MLLKTYEEEEKRSRDPSPRAHPNFGQIHLISWSLQSAEQILSYKVLCTDQSMEFHKERREI